MRCRACGSGDLVPWFSLGEQPLANALLNQPGDAPTYPLAVQRCPICHLSQLTHVISPDLLYAGYPYLSGVSRGWHRHCRGLVAVVQEHCTDADFVIDLAANDGTLLEHFERSGYRVLGVDPAGLASTVPVRQAYWSMDLADEIVALHGKADVIVAQNVLGHVDDAVAFLRAAKRTLDPGGVLIVEVPRLDALLDKVAFDQIYHEHLSYWTLMALRYAAERAGLTLWRVNLLAVHGGSYRCWFRPGGASDQSVWDRVEVERQFGLGSARPYARFNAQVNAAMRKLAELLDWLDGKRLVGFGAAAKGTVLLNEMRRREMPLPMKVLDDSTLKQHRWIPGVNLPIVPPRSLREEDVVLVLPWNWTDEIIARCQLLDFSGQYLVPLPYPALR